VACTTPCGGDKSHAQSPPSLPMTCSLNPNSPSSCDSANACRPDDIGPTASSSSSASTHDGGDLTTLWYEAEDGGVSLLNGVKAEGSMISETWSSGLRQSSLDGSDRLDQSGRALIRYMTNDLREYIPEGSSADLTGKWYAAPGDLGTEQLEPPAEEDDIEDLDNPKHALVEMGFSEGEASSALRSSQRWGGGLLEAANILAEEKKTLEKKTWGSSISGLVTDLFGSSASSGLTKTYKSGKYKIVVSQTTCSSPTGGSPKGSVVKDEVVDIEELHFPTDEGDWIRGRMVDGCWINIHSLCEGRSCVWAEPLSVETQLLELGFPPEKAREAARRCSSVEAAVEFLANDLD